MENVPSLGDVVWTGASTATLRSSRRSWASTSGGVADQPLRAPSRGLLVDQRAGVVAVVLVCG
jgi:hypothetical protein